jgi:hypothetical protein
VGRETHWEKGHAKAGFSGGCDLVLHRRHIRAIRSGQKPDAEHGILTIAEQVLQGPVLGPPRGKLTPATPEALQRELPDDRFISDVFPPIRLIFPDGTKEPEPKGRYEIARVLKVQPLTGEHVLKAFAKDVPFDPDAKSAAAVDDTPLVDPQLLLDQRRVKEWSK